MDTLPCPSGAYIGLANGWYICMSFSVFGAPVAGFWRRSSWGEGPYWSGWVAEWAYVGSVLVVAAPRWGAHIIDSRRLRPRQFMSWRRMVTDHTNVEPIGMVNVPVRIPAYFYRARPAIFTL